MFYNNLLYNDSATSDSINNTLVELFWSTLPKKQDDCRRENFSGITFTEEIFSSKIIVGENSKGKNYSGYSLTKKSE